MFVLSLLAPHMECNKCQHSYMPCRNWKYTILSTISLSVLSNVYNVNVIQSRSDHNFTLSLPTVHLVDIQLLINSKILTII